MWQSWVRAFPQILAEVHQDKLECVGLMRPECVFCPSSAHPMRSLVIGAPSLSLTEARNQWPQHSLSINRLPLHSSFRIRYLTFLKGVHIHDLGNEHESSAGGGGGFTQMGQGGLRELVPSPGGTASGTGAWNKQRTAVRPRPDSLLVLSREPCGCSGGGGGALCYRSAVPLGLSDHGVVEGTGRECSGRMCAV